MTSLRKLRYNAGLQRKFVAQKVGITGKHLNDIEAGKVNLTDNVAKRLANVYNIDVETIKKIYMEGKRENDKSRFITETT